MKNSSKDSYILKSYSLAPRDLGEKLPTTDIAKEIKSKKLAWIHLDANNEKTKSWLTKECSYLDSIIISGLIAEETRPRIEKINNGIFLILRCVNLNENSDPEDMVSIRMWIDPCRIITVQKRNAKSIEDMENEILSGNAPSNAGDFFCLLLHNIYKRMEPFLGSLDEVMDDVEEEILDNPNVNLRGKLVNTRKQAISFRRYLVPQRDVFNSLVSMDLEWLDDLQKRKLREEYNNTMRYVEDLDSIRERAQIVKDELSNLLADKLNKNMYILSVIAAIFLPLGFLTGLLGINVGGIPGSENPNAFYIFSGSLIFIVILQILLFKKWKWF